MADNAPQSFSNHTKWVPAFHFLLMPILFTNLFWRIYRLVFVISKGQGRAEPFFEILIALALIMTALAARIFALQAQDRVIRLEEWIRWQKVLAPELFARFSDIKRSQLIALRFAPDAELPGLVARVLAGELQESKAIKQAIKNWRADNHRV
jgi:hypothetical protein